jgi:hypothetical protein
MCECNVPVITLNAVLMFYYLAIAEIHSYWTSSGLFASYCTALYWSVTVSTSTGYGDILPMSLFEMCKFQRKL